MQVNALSMSTGGVFMDGNKKLPRLLSIKEIQEFYFHDIGYKKLKCFLLNYIPYQKIGNSLDSQMKCKNKLHHQIQTFSNL